MDISQNTFATRLPKPCSTDGGSKLAALMMCMWGVVTPTQAATGVVPGVLKPRVTALQYMMKAAKSGQSAQAKRMAARADGPSSSTKKDAVSIVDLTTDAVCLRSTKSIACHAISQALAPEIISNNSRSLEASKVPQMELGGNDLMRVLNAF